MPAYAVPVANLLNGVRVEQGGRKPPVLFTAPGIRVDICDNGGSAIAMIKANRYDLVFMDHMMPGMDGIEAVTRIRALEGEYFKRLPVIALTVNALWGCGKCFYPRVLGKELFGLRGICGNGIR
ncbi:MAG: response regulator [Spirochaetaceae bacterium]|jgi:CheY-like chemotaxis protein|nr:response regulator [Spirochaetaceae bacterium]